MATGKITVTRTDKNAMMLRKISLYADGRLLYDLSANETKDFVFEEGMHKLYARIDWCKTPEISVAVLPDTPRHLELGSPIVLSPARRYAPLLFLAILIAGNLLGRQLNNTLILWLTFAVIFIGMIGMVFFFDIKPAIYYLIFARSKFIYLRKI